MPITICSFLSLHLRRFRTFFTQISCWFSNCSCRSFHLRLPSESHHFHWNSVCIKEKHPFIPYFPLPIFPLDRHPHYLFHSHTISPLRSRREIRWNEESVPPPPLLPLRPPDSGNGRRESVRIEESGRCFVSIVVCIYRVRRVESAPPADFRSREERWNKEENERRRSSKDELLQFIKFALFPWPLRSSLIHLFAAVSGFPVHFYVTTAFPVIYL